MVEIRHQIWQIIQIGDSDLKCNRTTIEVQELDDERLLGLGDPRPSLQVPIILLNLIEIVFLGILLLKFEILVVGILLAMEIFDTLGEFFLEAQNSILNALDEFLALDVEIQGHLWWREQRITVAIGLEPEMDHRLDHILINDSESSI